MPIYEHLDVHVQVGRVPTEIFFAHVVMMILVEFCGKYTEKKVGRMQLAGLVSSWIKLCVPI